MPTWKGPIEPEPQRLGDLVYERIGEAIIARRFEPGERIRDAAIAEELGVSRMPVREALQRLERIGLVEMSASRFTRVTEISDDEIAASLEYLGYQVGIALRMAVPRMTRSQRSRAVSLSRAVSDVCRTTEPADDIQVPEDGILRIYDALNVLYTHLAQASGNPVFERSYNEAWFGLERAQRGRPHLIQTPADIADAFSALADAIDAGDGAEAERIIRVQFRLDE